MFSRLKIVTFFIIYAIGATSIYSSSEILKSPPKETSVDDKIKEIETWISNVKDDTVRFAVEAVHGKWLAILSILYSDWNEKSISLRTKNISLRALLILKCEEDVETGIFPIWLQYASISRYEKWLIGIAVCEGKFMNAVREEIRKKYSRNFEEGASVFAKSISDLYDDVSKSFVYPVAVNEIRIPSEKTEVEMLCNSVIPTAEKKQKKACHLIFHLRNIVKSEIHLEEGLGITATDNIIFYGIVRRSSDFSKVAEIIQEISTQKNFSSCTIKINTFSNFLMDKRRNAPSTSFFLTFKATCAKTVEKNVFFNHVKTALKPHMYNKDDTGYIQIFQNPPLKRYSTTALFPPKPRV